MGGGEIRERLPDWVHSSAGGEAPRLIRKPDFGAMLAHRRKHEWRENAIEIVDCPTADKADRATCGASQVRQQRTQICIRHDILGARLNLKKRAIDIEEIGGAG